MSGVLYCVSRPRNKFSMKYSLPLFVMISILCIIRFPSLRSWFPFFSRQVKCLELSSCINVLPAVEFWGSDCQLSRCSLCPLLSKLAVCYWNNFLKNFVDLLWILMGFIPLEKSYTHRSRRDKPLASCSESWGTTLLSFLEPPWFEWENLWGRSLISWKGSFCD